MSTLDEALAAQIVTLLNPVPQQLYAIAAPLQRIYLPDPPNHTITTYPDPGLLPDRYAYGSGGGLAAFPAVPNSIPNMMRYIPGLIPFGEMPANAEPYVLQGGPYAAPVPRFTNVES